MRSASGAPTGTGHRRRWVCAPERLLAYLALGVATIYSGEHDQSTRWWHEVAALEDVPVAYRAEGHISLALLARYRGDLPTARREAALAVASSAMTGAQAVHAFALYASGEAAVEDDDHGLDLLARAAEQADLAGAEHVSQVARLARFATLVRIGDHDQAISLVMPLLHDERREGAWPQLWTTMRIEAELLSACDHAQDAAFLLRERDHVR